MNAERAKKFLPLIAAVAEGKTLQVKGKDGNWYGTHLNDFDPDRYRIKPEPRTFEIVVSKLSRGIYDARDWHGTLPDDGDPQWEHVTVMEVLK